MSIQTCLNVTNLTELSEGDHEHLSNLKLFYKSFLIIIMSFASLSAIFGNFLVIVAMIKEKTLRKTVSLS